MRELAECIVVIIIAFVITISIIVGLGVAAGSMTCNQFGETVGHSVSYRWLAGCFVQIDNSWVPYDSYYKYIRIDK